MVKSAPKYFALAALAFTLGVGASAFGETTGQYIDDASITTKVKASILNDSQLSVLNIGVDTLHGTVTLTGTVDNKQQEQQAITDAKLVDGVANVNDKLTVKSVSN